MVRLLGLLLGVGGCALGADAQADTHPDAHAGAAVASAPAAATTTPASGPDATATLIAVNTVCPVDGVKIDPAIPPVPARTRTGRLIGIGVDSQACAQQVRANPSLYVQDALANRRHRPSAP